jgi:hypothetical protein
MADNQEITNKHGALERIKAVKTAHLARLMSYPNVTGVAIGRREAGGKPTNELALVVMVTQKLPPEKLAPEAILPTEIDGVPVDVHQVGELRAHS